MTDLAAADPYEAHRKERLRHLGRNYAAHAVEGGLFMGGVAFVAPQTVLPRLAELLQAPPWMVGLAPAMMWIGIGLPPLFLAHHIERLPRYKPLVMVTGLLQRLPYLLAGLALLFLGGAHPNLTLAAVVLTPLVSGLFCGAGVTAWFELVARTLPSNRRASVFAVRNILSGSIGLGAGAIIAAVLARYPGTIGFGILHLFTFAFFMLSYIIFALIRETVRPPQNAGSPQTLKDNLRSVPDLLRSTPHLGRVLVCRGLTMGQFIMMPYLAIHALRVTGRPDSFLGFLVSLQMGGAVLGNFVAGWAGDRYGGKTVVLAGNVLMGLVSLAALPARTPFHFMVLFLFFGAAFFGTQVGMMTFSLEISPRDKRATSLALMSLVNVTCMGGASLLSGVLWGLGRGFAPGAVLAAVCLAAAATTLAGIPEPRRSAGAG